MFKRFIIVTLLIFMGLGVYSQGNNDSLIRTDNWHEFNARLYFNRRALIDSLKKENKHAVAEYRKIKVSENENQPNNCPDELKYAVPVISAREGVMLDFYLGDLDILDSGLNQDGFFHKNSNNDQSAIDIECGDITLGMISFWTAKTSSIVENIETSALSSETKDFLMLYWKLILLYIQSDEKLDPSIKDLGEQFLAKYPTSKYASFIRKNITDIRKIYRFNNFSLDFSAGVPILTGTITKYLSENSTISLRAGYEYRKWSFIFDYFICDFNVKDSLPRIDNIDLVNFSSYNAKGCGLKCGYTFLEPGRFRMKSLLGVEFYRLKNLYHDSEGNPVTQDGKIHPDIYVGIEGDLLLGKNMKLTNGRYDYIPLEEKHKFLAPCYLFFNFGFYPQIFKSATGFDGNMFTASAGIGLAIGSRAPIYIQKHQHNNKD
jgi:hypothetical protein